jgi:hypothetical protein
MSPDDAVSELNEIKNIAKINGYPEHFLDRIHTKHLKKNELQRLTTLIPVSKDRPNKRHSITFYPHITNKLQKIFRKHDINLVYSNKRKLRDILGNPSSEFWRNPGCIKSSVLVAMLHVSNSIIALSVQTIQKNPT